MKICQEIERGLDGGEVMVDHDDIAPSDDEFLDYVFNVPITSVLKPSEAFTGSIMVNSFSKPGKRFRETNNTQLLMSSQATVQEQVVCNALSIPTESGPSLSRNQKNNIKKRLKRRAASMNTFSEPTVQEQVVCNALSIPTELESSLSRNQKNNIKKD
jgi:hypothetical protein